MIAVSLKKFALLGTLILVLAGALAIANEARKEVYYLCGNFTQGVTYSSVVRQLDTSTFSDYVVSNTPDGQRLALSSTLNARQFGCHIRFDKARRVASATYRSPFHLLSITQNNEKDNRMIVSGTFDVALAPMDAFAQGVENTKLNRMSIDKTFHGPLSATSQGEMLSAMTPVQGSAGYVAIEQVVGTLDGKTGTFVLQHYGLMSGGSNSLTLEVVPDSGTGELKGLAGSMKINIEQGQHFYEFEYALASTL